MSFLRKNIFLISFILWPQIGFTEGGGLPQMDITTFPSQVFWLIITFGVLYLFMWRTAIPKLRNTIEERQDKILLDINEAEKLKTDAEKTLKEYEEKMQSVSKKASDIINNAKNNSDVMLDEIKKKQELKLTEMLIKSKARIEKQYEESKTQIEKAKIDTVKMISSKFISDLPNDEEIRKEIN
jgi:F-type H+-transporting ATPase subunit b